MFVDAGERKSRLQRGNAQKSRGSPAGNFRPVLILEFIIRGALGTPNVGFGFGFLLFIMFTLDCVNHAAEPPLTHNKQQALESAGVPKTQSATISRSGMCRAQQPATSRSGTCRAQHSQPATSRSGMCRAQQPATSRSGMCRA